MRSVTLLTPIEPSLSVRGGHSGGGHGNSRDLKGNPVGMFTVPCLLIDQGDLLGFSEKLWEVLPLESIFLKW